jgi:hypothetical protein
MKFILMGGVGLLLTITTFSQKLWTETDRKYLVENLVRTRDALIRETENLTDAQWDFKESPDRWSIRQVVEHINIWELLLMHEVSKALAAGEQPDLAKTAKPDSIRLETILEEKVHVSTDYTKPFTYTVPMGLTDGKTNVATFLKLRNESITYLNDATEDLRLYFYKSGRPSVHQVYITVFGHTERHIRQIRMIKTNSNYPKGK